MRCLYDSKGRPVFLGRKLGAGGEGSVYLVPNRPDLVAKVYHRTPDPVHTAKLRAMVDLGTERLRKFAAWPTETLHPKPGDPVCGLIMPKVENAQPIHLLYGPKSRLQHFPDADWRFLVHTAANVARAFRAISEHGCVIGDINENNVLVTPQATVWLIDCDSFQIAANGCVFPCAVGVLHFQPPEFQGRDSLRGLVRTPNHDNFGLAVLIFLLLFLGRHPFSGQYLGAGHLPLEQAIKEFRFAYGSGAARRQMRPPPATLPLEAVSPAVADLFERAFGPEGAKGTRPSAEAWVAALGKLECELSRCAVNTSHAYWSGRQACPWCAIEEQSGSILFKVVLGSGRSAGGTFDLVAIWTEIAAVPSPGPAPALPTWQSLAQTPSLRAQRYRARRRRRRVMAIALVLLGLVLGMIGFPLRDGGALWNFIAVACVAWGVWSSEPDARLRAELRRTREEAQRRWVSIEARWKREAGDTAFMTLRAELEAAKQQYAQLPSLRREKLESLVRNQRQRQLHHFLNRHHLSVAQIKGIGPARLATLRSYGIETAADITETAVLAVPGFGPTLTHALVTWRRRLERQFVFDPKRGVDPADVAAVEREIQQLRTQLESRLRSGATELHQLARLSQRRRELLRQEVEEALRMLAQAEADWRQMN